jgi:hypothetical protein
MPKIPVEDILIYSNRIKKTVDRNPVYWKVLWLYADNNCYSVKFFVKFAFNVVLIFTCDPCMCHTYPNVR